MNIKKIQEKTIDSIARLDRIYSNSPTAQALVAQAPNILRNFKEMNMMAMQYKAELQALSVNREKDLKRFAIVAPGHLQHCNILLSNILHLQQTVRELAATLSSNPDSATVIEYTNKQIQQNIAIFQNISMALLNS